MKKAKVAPVYGLLKLVFVTSNPQSLFAEELGIRIQSVRKPAELEIDGLAVYDVVVIDGTDKDLSREAITRIRSSDREAIYLKPVFCFLPPQPGEPCILELFDGTTDLINLQPVAQRTKAIQDRTIKLEPMPARSHDLAVVVKALRYLYTRQDAQPQFRPFRSSQSRLGYEYPLLAVNLGEDDKHRMFELLEQAERENLLKGIYLDRIHLCGHCYSTHLSFRNVCASCGSTNLSTQDTIHHFVCAYIGPQSDFSVGMDLVCPKCGKELKHIGVDYDKPSVIDACNQCSAITQDSLVRALCFHCGVESDVNELVERIIKKYELTTQGNHSAVFGIPILLKNLISIEGVTDYAVFEVMLRNECERVSRTDRESCVAYLAFDNLYDLYLAVKEHKEKVFKEIANVIKENIRSSDVLSYRNEATLVFLLTDTGIEGARIVIERIRDTSAQLIRDNLKKANVMIAGRAMPIAKQSSLEKVLQELFSD